MTVEPPTPPVVPLADEIMYRGYRIQLASYAVGAAWSPRAVVAAKTGDGAWHPTPLYSTSSVKFPTRADADRHALDVATTWIDAQVTPARPLRA